MLYYCILLSKEFLWFSIVLTPVKTIVPVKTAIAICLMIFFVIYILEDIRTWLTNFGSCMVEFFIFSATPCHFSVMFSRMSSITFGAPGDIRATTKYWVIPLLTAFILRNSWICVCILNDSNVLSYVKTVIDDILC